LASNKAGRTTWSDGNYEAHIHPLVTLNAGNAKISIGAHTTGTGVASGSGYNLWENSNEKFYGSLHYGRLWTSADTPGLAILSLGNNETAETAGSASGEIDLYSTTQYCAKIVYTDTASANRKYTIPNVAAADFVMAAGNQTISGAKTFSETTTFNNKIVGKSGAVSTGNYTTTIPTEAGVTGQIMFVLQ